MMDSAPAHLNSIWRQSKDTGLVFIGDDVLSDLCLRVPLAEFDSPNVENAISTLVICLSVEAVLRR